MLKIGGAYYAFDLPKICDFIAEKSGRELAETEILDSFDFSNNGERTLIAKTLR